MRQTSATERLQALRDNGERIDDTLRHADSLRQRAPLLAEMLRSLWPTSPLYACLLEAKNDAYLSVLDESGKSRSDWAQSLLNSVRGFLEGRGDAGSSGESLSTVNLPGHNLLAQMIRFRSQRWGVLALATAKNASTEELALVRTLLAISGEQLAARLDTEFQGRCQEAVHKEVEGQSWLANTGEMAGPLAHEFNNFLNVVLLHVALMEPELPEKLRSELKELRRQAANMTSLVKQFQQYRRRQQSIPDPIELNQLVNDTVGNLAAPQAKSSQQWFITVPGSSRIATAESARAALVPLTVALAPGLPAVRGAVTDLKRLCMFLLVNAAAAAGPSGGNVVIRTESSNGAVLLRVEDSGPSAPPELLPVLFEPSTGGRAGTNSLELAACETLVRRLQGKIRCENRPEGGVAVIVQLPIAQAETT